MLDKRCRIYQSLQFSSCYVLLSSTEVSQTVQGENSYTEIVLQRDEPFRVYESFDLGLELRTALS